MLSVCHACQLGVLGPWLGFVGACLFGGLSLWSFTCVPATPLSGASGPCCRYYPARSSRRKCKACLLIWLVLSPQATGVQVWQQGQVNGQPVFNTGGVPVTSDKYDLEPVRLPDTPVVDPHSLRRPAYLKDICIFKPNEDPCHQVLVADIRLSGPLLGSWICRAFGLQDSEWSCRRLCEPLPALPSEQYVLSPRSLLWHRSLIPVDLRPIGGPVRLCEAMRCQPCGDIVLQALAGLPTVSVRDGFVCRCSHGWFEPSAYLTLLPYGDSLQVWSPQNMPSATVPLPDDSLPVTATIEDRFALSLERTPGTEVAFHEVVGATAVVLGVNGHVYADVPTFADHQIIRSAALQAYLRHERGSQEALHFVRIMPPLQGLPTIQFAAVQCGGTDVPAVVDMRPLGGGLVALCVVDRALPYHCVEAAVRQYGDPDPQRPLHSQLQAGTVLVLHRERVIDAFSSPAPGSLRAYVLIRKQATRSPMSEPTAADTLDSVSSASPFSWFGLCRVARFGLLGVWSMHTGSPRQFLAMLFLLSLPWVGSVGLPDAVGVPPLEWRSSTPAPFEASYGLTSCLQHARLASRWRLSADEEAIGGRSCSAMPGISSQHFRIEAYSPAQRQWLWAPSTATQSALQAAVAQLAVIPGRAEAVLASPQLLRRSIQLIVPARDVQLRTIIVDVGFDVICLDVPKAQAGRAILQALELLYPGRTFRLDVTSSQALCNGDVVYGFEDRFEQFEIGPVAWPSLHSAPFSIRRPGPDAAEDVIVSAADFDLLHLQLPPRTSGNMLSAVLTQWLGRQRCLDITLHRLALPPGLPRTFCLPRRHRSTLTAVLFDLADCVQPVLVHTIEAEGRQAPTPLDLCVCSKHGSLWAAIFACRTDCLYRSTVPASMTLLGFGHEQLFIAVDISRAGLFGLGLTTAMRPSAWDIQARASALKVHSEIVQEVDRQEAASQTVPAHWHPAASPLYSAALPIRKAATGCVLDATFPSVGTLFHLECPLMGVHCTIPCHSRRHIWALRTDDVVRGLCTPEVSWAVLIKVLGISAWDLPGTIVHNGHDVWEWPDDLAPLAGSCGHVLEKDVQHKGGQTICYPQPLTSAGWTSHTHPPNGAVAAGCSLALLSGRSWLLTLLGWAVSWSLAAAAPPQISADAASPASGLVFDPTQTCNVGWCHELACQATHFATSTGRLADYFRRRSPFETVRVLLWQPFRGPTAFDVQRGPSVVLAQTLAAAGHDAAARQLFVAFDSQATTVDILSVPYGHSVWWIIRDGMSRELLRPVAPWYHDREVRVVTVNSPMGRQVRLFTPLRLPLLSASHKVLVALHLSLLLVS